ncbi:MAG: DUF362 domain-containing protein [Anaerolineae bacterium]|nr:DUF362 domain-containing protein [Anaerolineae bacterium]MDW8099369.1 DUF362 domain-containing protein [Anaerolineae bacterium]
MSRHPVSRQRGRSSHRRTRREFLTFAAATVCAACAPLMPGTLSTPSVAEPAPPTPSPAFITKQGAPPRAQVALIRTTDRAEGTRRALSLLSIQPPSGVPTLLKPNFNSADPTPGSTHLDVLRTLVRWLQDNGVDAITVADRSGMGNTRRVMEQKGIFALGQELGFKVQVLDELPADGWELVQLPDGHWRNGFPIARLARETPYIVQTCCLKTHRYGGHFTLSLKNSVGLVAKIVPGQSYNYMNELHNSPYQRLMIAEINAAYVPNVIVLDGVEAFVRGGPERGELVQAGVILASTDRIAIDAVGVAILRSFGTTPEVSRGPIFEQEQIARAVELGIGVTKPEQIEIVSDDKEGRAFVAQIQELLVAE